MLEAALVRYPHLVTPDKRTFPLYGRNTPHVGTNALISRLRSKDTI